MLTKINRSFRPNSNSTVSHFFLGKSIVLFSPSQTFKYFIVQPTNKLINRYSFPNIYNERHYSTCRQCSFQLGHCYHNKLNSFSNQFWFSCSDFVRKLCPKTYNIYELQKRYKSKKPQKRPEYDSDSDEEEDDDSEGLSKGTKPITLRVQSLRLDGLLRKTLNLARNKVETAFYEGSLRVNGTKPNKKSYQAKVGDEVDLIKGVSPLNPDFLAVSRVEILSAKEDPDEEGEQLIVKVRRTKTLYIENYETNPWKKSSSAE